MRLDVKVGANKRAMRVGCIIQARMGSTRLPGKALAEIGGWPMIRHVYERMLKVGIPVVVAAPLEIDQPRIPYAEFYDIDPNDVLQRYLLVAQKHSFDAVMRVTGDCPLIDPDICKQVLEVFLKAYPGVQYVANDIWPSYPDGLGCEVFTRAALEDAHRWAKSQSKGDREHVTSWIKRGLNLNGGRWFCGLNIRSPLGGLQDLKFSVDTQGDLARARAIDARLPEGHLKYSMEATLTAYAEHLLAANREIDKQPYQQVGAGYGDNRHPAKGDARGHDRPPP